MSFDRTWESVFQSRTWGRYPNETVVRFMMSRFPNGQERKSVRVLDLGCGGGANLWFLVREGFSAYGLDGSDSAIEQARVLLSSDRLQAELSVGDFRRLKFDDGFFDVVIDANAVQHNLFSDIQATHSEIYRVLKPGGAFFGNLINDETSGAETAEKIEEGTYRGFQKGPIKIPVVTHLFNLNEIKMLLSPYESVQIDSLVQTCANGSERTGHFIVAANKNGGGRG